MPVLPASVRVALWASAALNSHADLSGLDAHALPDIDEVRGLGEALRGWRDVGEQVVLVALPRPGRHHGLPAGPADMVAAALASEEVVFVPGVGGALVPQVSAYGPEGDQGWRIDWTAFSADPVPRHIVQAMSVSEAELRLRTTLAQLTDRLSMTPGSPMAGAAAEVFARRGMGEDWGLPSGLPRRCAKVVELAGAVLHLSDVGLSDGMQSVDSASTTTREAVLRQLRDAASDALVTATNVAALSYAGWA
ncbi:MAG: hypothetical protein WA892_03955 [Ornithinimicrobium sp.]